MSTSTVAANAIARSVSHNEIAHIDLTVVPYDSAILSDLLVACDDWTDASETVTEYWGTTDDGDEWRVHVRHYEQSSKASGVYSVDDGEGNQITTGLGRNEAWRVARRIADDRGCAVYLYESGSTAEPEEIRPSDESERADYDV